MTAPELERGKAAEREHTRSMEALMRRAFAEARKAHGQTGPNPAVGALLVRAGHVVARGYHHSAGEPHAEIMALRDGARRGVDLARCTLFTTLEPCSHHGRTGPCADAIIAAGVRSVVYGCIDPNPRVAGRGLKKLAAAGVRLHGPVLEAEALAMIADFAASIRTGRPYVLAKLAETIDGRSATKGGESQWITGEAARAVGRSLRGEVQAIAVGIGTVLADDPALTARTRGRLDPLRVVFDSGLRTPVRARVVRGPAPGCVIITAANAPRGREAALVAAGAHVWRLPGAQPSVRVALTRLYRELGVMRLLVEGGAALMGSFHDQGCIDELHAFVAPLMFGGAAKPSVCGRGVSRIADARRLALSAVRQIGDDVHLVYTTPSTTSARRRRGARRRAVSA